MPIIQEFLNTDVKSPFGKWFNNLNHQAAAKVSIALARLEVGNYSNVKSLASSLWELKIDHGPGYRVYFTHEGDEIVLLLCGGSKKQQQRDISLAKNYLKEYKLRSRGH